MTDFNFKLLSKKREKKDIHFNGLYSLFKEKNAYKL